MAKDIANLIRKKQAERKKLVEQIRQIDIELDGLVSASEAIGMATSVRKMAKG